MCFKMLNSTCITSQLVQGDKPVTYCTTVGQGPSQTEHFLAAWAGVLQLFSMRVNLFAWCYCIDECQGFFFKQNVGSGGYTP